MITWRFAVQLNRSLVEIVGLVIEKTQVVYVKSFSWVVVKKTFQVTSSHKSSLILCLPRRNPHRLEESSPDSGVQERWRRWHEQLQPDIALVFLARLWNLAYPIQSLDMFSKITWSQINSGPTARGTFSFNASIIMWVKMKTKWKLSAKFRVYSLV